MQCLQKVIAHKTNLTDEEMKTETMFNRKHKLFTCDNFRAANDVSCAFYMRGQCHMDVYINDEKENDRARKSRRTRK